MLPVKPGRREEMEWRTWELAPSKLTDQTEYKKNWNFLQEIKNHEGAKKYLWYEHKSYYLDSSRKFMIL